ncbi:MAG: hypothetical protein P8L21_00635 [Polaribacter sp.]|jgi:hypothetical protein|nr:hypothetical protein [Polaribacter sp.]
MKKKIIYLLLLALPLVLITSCEENAVGTPNLNYVSFEANTYNFGVDIDGENTNTISIYASTKSASARTVEVVVISEETSADEASYTVPTSFTIPANSNVGELPITISDLNISSGGETLTIALVSKAGLFVGGNITLNVRQVCPFNDVNIKIEFDDYPEEVYWVLEDSNGAIVAESAAGVYGAYAGLSDPINVPLCLENDTYTFTVYDQYQDGAGAISITSAGTVLYSTDGAYGPGAVASFTL